MSQTIASLVAGFIAGARLKAQGGITLVEAGQLVFDLLQTVMLAADQYRDVPGPQRKEWVLAAVGQLLDVLTPFLPLPVRLASPILRPVVLAIVSGAVESLLPTVRAAR